MMRLFDRLRSFTLTSFGRDYSPNRARAGEDMVLFSDVEGEYRHLTSDEIEDDQDDLSSSDSTRAGLGRGQQSSSLVFGLCVFIGLGWTIGLYTIYPSPSTVPVFIGLAFILGSWVVTTWVTLLSSLLRRRETARKIWSRYSTKFRVGLGVASVLVLWWTIISLHHVDEWPKPPTMIGNGDKYFIAINLYNNEAIMSDFISELTALIFHLGRHDVFVSIYESNSWDGTKAFLAGFDDSLTQLGVDHRIVSVDNDPGKSWPYGTSPERISFLAKCRNKAMEPIQSADDQIRIQGWQDYTKLLFLNDIQFKWQDMVKLILTNVDQDEQEEGASGEEGYDMACAMDFGSSGLYDTWVARDICGTPFRAFWPFVADRPSQKAMRAERPFEVSACWNGAVVLDAKPFLYSSSANTTSPERSSQPVRRGWKMIDDPNYPGGRTSPPLASPLTFRTSGIDACDHSECFLLSYDLQRLYRSTQNRRARILMNPGVRVAYEKTWFHWNNTVLRRPIIQWWRGLWSHRIGYWLFDWPFEYFGRRRDYCTWAGLGVPTDDGRCPPLPGPTERHWDE